MILTALSPIEIVKLTVIGEARGEPPEGQIAVANVINNRFHAGRIKYPTYTFVCLEKEQFSCWNDSDPNRAYLLELGQKMVAGQLIIDPYLEQCMYLAEGVMDGKILDNTGGATHYIAKSLGMFPKWAANRKNIREIGQQTFFNV